MCVCACICVYIRIYIGMYVCHPKYLTESKINNGSPLANHLTTPADNQSSTAYVSTLAITRFPSAEALQLHTQLERGRPGPRYARAVRGGGGGTAQ